MDHKKTQRLWREEDLRLPQSRRTNSGGTSTSAPPFVAAYLNHVWAIDFQKDHPEDVSGFKMASILDEQTRLVLDDTIDAPSLTGDAAARHPARYAAPRAGLLPASRADHLCPLHALRQPHLPGLHARRIGGLPVPRLRRIVPLPAARRVPQINVFTSLLHARVEVKDWHHEHNQVRRHLSLG